MTPTTTTAASAAGRPAPPDAPGAPGSVPAPAPTIRLLPPDLVAKIAAGEVVERPASVVKELVENALDAGATAVRVEIQRGGLSLIRVSDNGCGIPPAQMELAVLRHATSKLQAFDDLYRVRTLGFRGEALASVAAVSHLELTSRPAALPAAQAVRVEGGEIRWQGQAGAPAGTTVTIRHLFYNVPARQAFQRTAVGEGRHIVQLCQHLALTAPGVRFRVEVDGRLALQAPGNGSLRDAIGAVYGAAVAGNMLALPELEEEGTRVWGYCSGPAEHRNTRLYCTFAINGRLVRSQMLTYAVEEAYHALLPGGRHPLAAIHLTVPPDDLDVNVHPTKSEVRFRHERLVFAALRRALRRALSEFAPIPALSPSAVGGAPPTADGAQGEAAGGGQETEGEQAAPGAPGAGPARLVQAPAPPPRAGGAPASPGGGLRALGQIGLTYVVAEDGAGLYLIDQHSAHERVVYEQLLQQATSEEGAAGLSAQLLLTPETLDLNGAQSAWLQEHGQTLTRFGFQLEPFGGRTWLLRAVPRTVAARGRARALGELIDGLIEREYGDGPLDDQARWAVACHSAVRAGDRLAPEEMAALIAQLERCDMRRTCPHGRPTMIHLSHSQLEREFGRR